MIQISFGPTSLGSGKGEQKIPIYIKLLGQRFKWLTQPIKKPSFVICALYGLWLRRRSAKAPIVSVIARGIWIYIGIIGHIFKEPGKLGNRVDLVCFCINCNCNARAGREESVPEINHHPIPTTRIHQIHRVVSDVGIFIQGKRVVDAGGEAVRGDPAVGGAGVVIVPSTKFLPILRWKSGD